MLASYTVYTKQYNCIHCLRNQGTLFVLYPSILPNGRQLCVQYTVLPLPCGMFSDSTAIWDSPGRQTTPGAPLMANWLLLDCRVTRSIPTHPLGLPSAGTPSCGDDRMSGQTIGAAWHCVVAGHSGSSQPHLHCAFLVRHFNWGCLEQEPQKHNVKQSVYCMSNFAVLCHGVGHGGV